MLQWENSLDHIGCAASICSMLDNPSCCNHSGTLPRALNISGTKHQDCVFGSFLLHFATHKPHDSNPSTCFCPSGCKPLPLLDSCCCCCLVTTAAAATHCAIELCPVQLLFTDGSVSSKSPDDSRNSCSVAIQIDPELTVELNDRDLLALGEDTSGLARVISLCSASCKLGLIDRASSAILSVSGTNCKLSSISEGFVSRIGHPMSFLLPCKFSSPCPSAFSDDITIAESILVTRV
mmetsp:Transcript_23198/g.37080  ORF Transcript_23198/g.37080 Transcript_23198/m.37080 type:complete len:236 (-) Transcript_23198:89-796(-)